MAAFAPTGTPTGGPTCADEEPPATAGSAVGGDPYFPHDGDGGYTATRYYADLIYTPAGNGSRRARKPLAATVNADVSIGAKATQTLSSFDLDFAGPPVTAVTVNGRQATYRQADGKLSVVPATPLTQGSDFTTTVQYSGAPRPRVSDALGPYGWVPTSDGAIAVGEPDGAPTWLPCDDQLQDRATFGYRVTVPRGFTVIANGTESPPVHQGSLTTYAWNETSPMAPYLASIAIGHFTVKTGQAGRTPVLVAANAPFVGAIPRVYASTVRAMRLATSLFGPYPFAGVGGVIDGAGLDAVVESQERPIYAGFVPDGDYVMHEIAHQWFGDSVGLRQWSDIWLTEGFATYAEWLWNGANGGQTPAREFATYDAQPAHSAIFMPPPAHPGAGGVFDFSVYIRGAMALQALRTLVGDRAFFTILRDWATRHRDATVSTPEFVALAKHETAGRVPPARIDALFHAWLYAKGKPKTW
jgi:aminopeptidase N